MPTTKRFKMMTVSGFSSLNKPSGTATEHLSAHVLDRYFNHRIVAAFRTEDWGTLGNRSNAWRRREVRRLAIRRRTELNAWHERLTV